MFVIVVYDVGEKRVAKVLKRCRKYFHWVQNSVFEGETTEAGLTKFQLDIAQIIDPHEDSVIIYSFLSTRYSDRRIMGLHKGGPDLII